MPNKSKPPATGGNGGVLPAKLSKKKRPSAPKQGFNPDQARLPGGLKRLPGGGKGGKPPRFPGRAGGR